MVGGTIIPKLNAVFICKKNCMKLELSKIGSPFLMELKNEQGNSCLIDASSTIGGTNQGFRPMELLAGSLAGCISIDVLNILKKQRVEIQHYSVRIDAKRKDAVPSPFEQIHLVFELKGEIDLARLEKNIQLTIDKYCSVAVSLDPSISITFGINLIEK